MTLEFDRVISADSHVMEPSDIYWKALGAKYSERTPRNIDEHRGIKGNFFFTGKQVLTLGEGDKTQAEKGLRPAGFLPEKRVEFQVNAKVAAEVLYGTGFLIMMQSEDAEVLQASAQVFNDWLADFSGYDNKRLLGVGMIPTADPVWAAKELERIAKRGLIGACINLQGPVGGVPYRDRSYEPLWARAQEMDIPLTLHSITGRVPDPYHVYSQREKDEVVGNLLALGFEIQAALANDFIFGTILDRFPRLRLICSEFEIAWIPRFLWFIDQILVTRASRISLPPLKMKPSEYMRTRIWHGMIDDPFAAQVIAPIGPDRILWGSDFPHVRSIGLETQSRLKSLFADLTRPEQEKIVGGNVAALYRLN